MFKKIVITIVALHQSSFEFIKIWMEEPYLEKFFEEIFNRGNEVSTIAVIIVCKEGGDGYEKWFYLLWKARIHTVFIVKE